jgi:hypothetical protein
MCPPRARRTLSILDGIDDTKAVQYSTEIFDDQTIFTCSMISERDVGLIADTSFFSFAQACWIGLRSGEHPGHFHMRGMFSVSNQSFTFFGTVTGSAILKEMRAVETVHFSRDMLLCNTKVDSRINRGPLWHHPQSTRSTRRQTAPEHDRGRVFHHRNSGTFMISLILGTTHMWKVKGKLGDKRLIRKQDLLPVICCPVAILPAEMNTISNILGG